MIDHVQNAFVDYQKDLKTVRTGGLVVFHERFWQGYSGRDTNSKREIDLYPIHLNLLFAHTFSAQLDLINEHEHQDSRWTC